MSDNQKRIFNRELGIEVSVFIHKGINYNIPSVLGERFELYDILAAGGFGAIFMARDRRIFDRKVLIKANRYDANLFQYPNDRARERTIKEQRERLVHEMKMLGVANDRAIAGTPFLIELIYMPNPQIYGPHQSTQGSAFTVDTKQCEGEPYLVLSYIEGMTLDQSCQIPAFRRNLLGYTKSILLQISGVLDAFHQYKKYKQYELAFIYQDLKPDNIIWTNTNNAVLIDFGSFAARSRDQVIPKNLCVATPPYQPPEFMSNLPPTESIQPSADIYSLGVTLLHILRGNPPIDGNTGEADLRLEQLSIPDAWRDWLRIALNPDPRQRFASMEDARGMGFTLPTEKALAQEATNV
jgi:serine/threonine-protein kinase